MPPWTPIQNCGSISRPHTLCPLLWFQPRPTRCFRNNPEGMPAISRGSRQPPPVCMSMRNPIPEGSRFSGIPPGCGVYNTATRWYRREAPQPPANRLEASGFMRNRATPAKPANMYGMNAPLRSYCFRIIGIHTGNRRDEESEAMEKDAWDIHENLVFKRFSVDFLRCFLPRGRGQSGSSAAPATEMSWFWTARRFGAAKARSGLEPSTPRAACSKKRNTSCRKIF